MRNKENISISIPRGIKEQLKSGAEKEKLSLSDYLIFKATGLRAVKIKKTRTYNKIVNGKIYSSEAIGKEVVYR